MKMTAAANQHEIDHKTVTEEICIKWHIEDVQSIRPDLTNHQAGMVLRHLKENHDASIGINWETIEIVADILFPVEQAPASNTTSL